MDAAVQEVVDFRFFVSDLEALIPVMLPGVQLVRDPSVLTIRRGRSAVELHAASWAECSIALRFDDETILRVTVPLTPSRLGDLRADVVGFLCGAPLGSFSICPPPGPKPELKPRRASRRRAEVRLASWWSREQRNPFG